VEGCAGEDPAGGAAHQDVPEGQPAGRGGDGAARGCGLTVRMRATSSSRPTTVQA
jgi:hypothetical protein